MEMEGLLVVTENVLHPGIATNGGYYGDCSLKYLIETFSEF